MGQIFYLLLLIFFTILSLILAAFWVSNLVAQIKGAVYVPTKYSQIEQILKKINPKKSQKFIELGSGDGRFLITAFLKYNVSGLGVDINPILVFIARLFAYFKRAKGVRFIHGNFYDVNLAHADVIFVFLMPNTLVKLKSKFLKECKKNALLVSHGFFIEGWDKYLVDKLNNKPFPTYFYRLKSRS